MRALLAPSRCPRCGGNVYLGTGRHTLYKQYLKCGCIRDIGDTREVADMISALDKEIPKLNEPVMIRQAGEISARVYFSKLALNCPLDAKGQNERQNVSLGEN